MNSFSESQRDRQAAAGASAASRIVNCRSSAGEVVAEREPGLAASDDDDVVASEGVHHATWVLEGVKRATQQAAEQHEQQCSGGAEHGELILDAHADRGGRDPAEAEQNRHRGCPGGGKSAVSLMCQDESLGGPE